MNKVCKTSDKDYVIYSDTDSVVGGTEITINGRKLTIEDYFDSISNENLVCDTNKDYVKSVSDDVSPSMNKQFEIENKPVKYVMKHKVKKRMFKIKANGKEVIVTEDHSVMVKRDGELVEVKPVGIKKGDKIIQII